MPTVSPYVYPGLAKSIPVASPEQLLELCCKKTRYEVGQITGSSRKNEHVAVRQIYCYLCRKATAATLEEIGKFINRDHSTVTYAIKQANNRLEVGDQMFMRMYSSITNILQFIY